jgi:hypothetical protein
MNIHGRGGGGQRFHAKIKHHKNLFQTFFGIMGG